MTTDISHYVRTRFIFVGSGYGVLRHFIVESGVKHHSPNPQIQNEFRHFERYLYNL
jgi:hypothetical protein